MSATISLADRLKYPNSLPICVVEIIVPQTLFHWTNDPFYTNTWGAPTTNRIIGCNEDGAALTEQATHTLCNSNNASYYWDSAAGQVYINSTAADPRTIGVLIQPTAKFHFCTHRKQYDNIPYHARILAAPKSSRRIPLFPGDTGQVAGGKLSIANAGWLDDKTDLDWGAATVTMKFGLDLW